MPTYLCKTEPTDYSYDDLVRDRATVWDGVSNPAACIHIRAVKKGDDVLIYHTGSEKAIVGLARATSGPMHDPAKDEATTAKGDIKHPVFRIEPVAAARTPLTLTEVKADDRFAGFGLVTQGRLSVMPVPAKLDKAIRALTGLPK